jgi:hypothetical protein
MHAKRKEAAQDIPIVSKVDGDDQGNRQLFKFLKSFTRPVRRRPTHLLLDGFDHEFCILFNFETDPEMTDEQRGTCDIEIVPLPTNDVVADGVRLVANANRYGVLRFIAAIGVSRFDNKVKTAFYASTNPLRCVK